MAARRHTAPGAVTVDAHVLCCRAAEGPLARLWRVAGLLRLSSASLARVRTTEGKRVQSDDAARFGRRDVWCRIRPGGTG